MAKNQRDSYSKEESDQSHHEGCCEGGGCGCGWHRFWKYSHRHHHHSNHGALYCLGAVGGAIFFLQHSTGFWEGALAILKGLAWPAFLVYKALGLAGF